jgi:hypothetical protein
MPSIVETIVCGKIDDHKIDTSGVVGGDRGCSLAIGKREHDRLDTKPGQLFVLRGAVAQCAVISGHVVRHTLAIALARGHEGKFEFWMSGDQPDQVAAHISACPDDTDSDAHRVAPRASCLGALPSKTAWIHFFDGEKIGVEAIRCQPQNGNTTATRDQSRSP